MQFQKFSEAFVDGIWMSRKGVDRQQCVVDQMVLPAMFLAPKNTACRVGCFICLLGLY